MKKLSLLLILAFSLFIVSCESTTNDSASIDQEDAAYAVLVLNDAMQKVPQQALTDLINMPDTEEAASKVDIPFTPLYTSATMTITSKIVLTQGWSGVLLGLGMTVTYKDYEIQTADGSKQTVSGVLYVVVAYRTTLIKNELLVRANTPDKTKQLVFTGGPLNGQKLGLKDVEMTFDLAAVTGGISLGTPVAVKGTVLINDISVYIDSEIIELLLGLIS